MKERTWMKAARRYEVIEKVKVGVLKNNEAACFLNVTTRHFRRLKKQAEKDGIKGLLFQRTHRPWNKISEEIREEIIELRRNRYLDFNVTHFKDMLKTRHKINISRESLRGMLFSEKLIKPRKQKRRKKRHRKRFEAPSAGILIQRDTSIHLWVPNADKPWKLILDLDDHSRTITGAVISERDDVLSNMLVCWETASKYGLPVAYYTDNNPIYNPKNKKPRHGMYQLYRMQHGEVEESLSQWKRALHELGIECIHARPYQPQGKGKIERIFRFMQDRLVNELVDANVRTIAQANKYLQKWVAWYNTHHFHSETKCIPMERLLKNNSFRKLPDSLDLNEVFCLKMERLVKSDNTFEHEGKTYQIKANEYRASYAKAKVDVRIYLSGQMKVYYKNKEIGAYLYKPPKTLHFLKEADIFA